MKFWLVRKVIKTLANEVLMTQTLAVFELINKMLVNANTGSFTVFVL